MTLGFTLCAVKVETDLLEEFEVTNILLLEDPLPKNCFHTILESSTLNATSLVVSDNYLRISVHTFFAARQKNTIYFFKQRLDTKLANKKCLRGTVRLAYVTLKSIAYDIVLV